MTQTQKSDWLNDWFAQLPGYLVSGHPEFNKKLNLTIKDASCAVRYISLKNNYIYILTIETPKKNWSDIKRDFINNQVYDYLNKMFGNDLAIILFSPGNSTSFSLKRPNSVFIDLDSESLVKEIVKDIPRINSEVGDPKEINRSINDAFQIWTREFLSRFCVVNDFDALKCQKNSLTLVELKRVKENHSTWMPYLDDYGNYTRVNKISSIFKFSSPFTISYNSENEKTYSLHHLTNVQKEFITGIATDFDAINKNMLSHTKRNYRSTRRRKK